MKLATSAKLPKKTSARVNDPDDPAWTEDMLGAPVLKRGRGPQATPTKVLTSVRLDADILEFFKSQWSGYQSRINEGNKRRRQARKDRNLRCKRRQGAQGQVTHLALSAPKRYIFSSVLCTYSLG